jgi:hypothetical protein
VNFKILLNLSLVLKFAVCGHDMKQVWVKVKAIPVTGRVCPYGCETSTLPHFLDNRLTDGSEVVSLTRLPRFTPRKISGTHF